MEYLKKISGLSFAFTILGFNIYYGISFNSLLAGLKLCGNFALIIFILSFFIPEKKGKKSSLSKQKAIR